MEFINGKYAPTAHLFTEHTANIYFVSLWHLLSQSIM